MVVVAYYTVFSRRQKEARESAIEVNRIQQRQLILDELMDVLQDMVRHKYKTAHSLVEVKLKIAVYFDEEDVLHLEQLLNDFLNERTHHQMLTVLKQVESLVNKA